MDKKKIKKNIMIFILSVICLMFTSCNKNDDILMEIEELSKDDQKEIPDEKDEINETGKPDMKEIEEYVYVHVCGAVNSPGVYKLKTPVRVYEAIDSAGGITDEGCEEVINQAREIVDGEQIYIPTFEEKENGNYINEQSSDVTQVNDGIININTASEEQLMTLPGIGQAKAASIINYRNDNGKFSSIEELKNIEGIKDGVFNKIKDKIII